jgi:hypothetical protein
MKNFLLDLWHDLRAKRLWPVAIALLAGLVAVPVVLSKDAAEPAATPAPSAKAAAPAEPEGPAALAEVKLEELGQGTGSSLSSFDDPSNPFAPPRKVLESLREEEGSGAGSGSGSGGGSDSKPEGGSPGDGGSSTGGGSSEPVTGDTGGGTDTGGDTGDTDGDTGDQSEETTNYTYVVDVMFRSGDRRRKIKALEKLDILPNPSSPLLIFLGVTQDAGNAVFLVDSTLEAVGEGSCKPSRSDCAFLYLGPGSEHEFVNAEGDSYTLRVDEIRRVELRDGKKAAAAKKKKDRKTANAAVGSDAPARRFALPILADLVSVSRGTGGNSNSDQDRR